MVRAYREKEDERPGLALEFRIVRPDGSIRHIRELAEALPNPDGPPDIWFGTIQDITDAKPAEEAVRHSEMRLQNILDHSPISVTIKDLNGRYLFVNRAFAERRGVPHHEIIGNTSDAVAPRHVAEALGTQDAETLRRLAAVVREWDISLGDGSLRKIVRTTFPVRDSLGAAVAVGSVSIDVTEQRTAEERLRQSEKMRAIGQLTSGLSHDFNNLLAVTIGNLDLLLLELKDREPKAWELAQSALTASLHGAELTKQLLAFARQQPLHPRVMDVNEVVARVVEFLRPILGEMVEIRTVLAPDVWRIEADPAQIELALTNLAINARDAMPAGGRLTFETANRQIDAADATPDSDLDPGDHVVLAVSDTGVGIPPHVRARIFEPFFTTKEGGRGSGLGLSMVYGFMKQSRGHVTLDSEEERGTIVRLYFPRTEAEFARSDSAMALADRSIGGELILVVEDDAMVRAAVIDQLAGLGYRTLEAGTAREALAILAREPVVDLIFTDMVLPGSMNGRDLAAAARRERSGIKVVLTSGSTATMLEGACDNEHWLLKPYRRRDLANMLHTVLAEDEAP